MKWRMPHPAYRRMSPIQAALLPIEIDHPHPAYRRRRRMHPAYYKTETWHHFRVYGIRNAGETFGSRDVFTQGLYPGPRRRTREAQLQSPTHGDAIWISGKDNVIRRVSLDELGSLELK
jgi:hypothetical protein